MQWYQFCSIVVTKRLQMTGVKAKKCHIFSHEEEESRNYIYHQPLHAHHSSWLEYREYANQVVTEN